MLCLKFFSALLSSAIVLFKKKGVSTKQLIVLATILAGGVVSVVLDEVQGGIFLDRLFLASNYFVFYVASTVIIVFTFANIYKENWIHSHEPGMISVNLPGLLGHEGLFLAGVMTSLGFEHFPDSSFATMTQIPPILFIGYLIGIIGLAFAFFRKRPILGLAQLTREAVIDEMSDGWMVVDNQDRIIDINPATEMFLGVLKKEVYGKPVSDILVEWPNIIKNPNVINELEMRRSVKGENGWRHIGVRISKLADQHQVTIGYLIIWRDLTQHKLAENARQKAREELFVLLNGISSVASHAMSLEDFLVEAIDQVIGTFHSQTIGVFLFDQDAGTITLTAHFGLSEAAVDGMQVLPISNNIWKEIVKTNQYVLIDNLNDKSLLHHKMQKLEYASILVLPLSTRLEETITFLGCMFLAKEKQNFSHDEIIRLSIISEHISLLIDNNRRLQFFIATSERQRLMRDLHDSVSQKLYGLVATTEAAQAALEAGLEIDPSQILVKMGDNARQAVREMRLFLYQMQPVDLENEGLVSVLNHRLAAVEGRANIKTRFLADEGISLSKEKEIALYYIAQEALNNILKHAYARSVSLTLKKTRRNIILEIQDDGIGFDIKKLDGAGLGLKNMRERTSQIEGKLKILSKPGEGTKIKVQVSRVQ